MTLRFHNCPQFHSAIKHPDYEDWDIRTENDGKTWELAVNDEYGIEIKYCPFCGVKP